MAHGVPTVGFADTKRHYPILDGLRGVAALMVVAFHLCEAHGPNRFEQWINHGYLAVDFFFLLSGFVIGYAYDDRWGRMSTLDFARRRLIRLHPMIIAGMAIGALMFYTQQGPVFPGIHDVPVWKMLLVMAVGMTLIPLAPSLDIRGWGEMHTLDAPAWSLLYEYVGNLLYALAVRKFSKTLLGLCVFAAGCVLLQYCLAGGHGDVIGGWSLEPANIRIGFTRMLYPFFAGLLLSRVARIGRIRHAFLLSSVIVVAVLAMPRFGGEHDLWKNGLYEALCILFVFPLVVYIGASGEVRTGMSAKFCGFLDALSYPLYIVHYPFIYTYTSWQASHKLALRDAWPVAAATFLFCVALAWAVLRFYDIPVRRWLTRRFMHQAQREVREAVASR